MANGSWVGTSESAEIIAADEYREYLTIQLTNTTLTALGIGEAAVASKGIQLINAGDAVRLVGAPARLVIYAIGNGATGTWQDGDVTYIPGPQVAT